MKAKIIIVSDDGIKVRVRRGHYLESLDRTSLRGVQVKPGDVIEVHRRVNNPYVQYGPKR